MSCFTHDFDKSDKSVDEEDAWSAVAPANNSKKDIIMEITSIGPFIFVIEKEDNSD
jgi:hypothetical protein